jgi:hypothetical protein
MQVFQAKIVSDTNHYVVKFKTIRNPMVIYAYFNKIYISAYTMAVISEYVSLKVTTTGYLFSTKCQQCFLGHWVQREN